MPRIPALTCVTMAGLLPIWAGALGLGDAQTRSALNQPLAIEIPLLAAADGEVAGLDVALASPATFDRYGLQPPVGLGELKFQVIQAAGGGTIRITSTQPVVEPFVTLLIEVRWPQGRLLREYTVLLDPPAFAAGAVQQPVQAPQAAAAPAAAIDRSAPDVPPPLAPAATGEQTHTVVSRETLWGIASRYRPDAAADMNQIMMAIYRANPDAFAGNINRLRAGAVLRIPSGDALRTGAANAGAEVQRQNEAWLRGTESPAGGGARLQLVPPAEQKPASAPVPAKASPPTAGASDIQTALAESQRLLAVRDAELAALREQLAALQSRQEAAAVPAKPEVVDAAVAAATPEPRAERPVASPARPAASAGSWSDALSEFAGSAWLWVGLLVALGGALFVVRRRASAEPGWRRGPQLAGAAAGGLAGIPIDDDEATEASARQGVVGTAGVVERRMAARPQSDFEEESPLERTISTEGPVNLDQADPLAEADFHMAYGLYDQAAELLNQGLALEPERRDLRMKLLEVCFNWENRDAFRSAAQGLREHISSDADPDWKRALVMGQQLCPGDSLFTGGGSAAAGDHDLPSAGDGDLQVDVPFIEEAASLDFDLTEAQSPQVSEPESESARYARPAWVAAGGGGVTVETPTIRSSAAQTLETPTIEARAGRQGTFEMPTIESPIAGQTAETPTVESWSRDLGDSARVAALQVPRGAEDRVDEIDLDNLGLDLSGLDDAADDITTGLQEALSADPERIDLNFDGELGDSGLDPTADMAGIDAAEPSEPLERLTAAMEKSATSGGLDDTAEQPAPGLAKVAGLAGVAKDSEVADLGVSLAATAEMEQPAARADTTTAGLHSVRSRAEEPTMTEVGTKLDLARAYLDMGDPDGARSILNEVLEEGDAAQRQEAQQILDTLGD